MTMTAVDGRDLDRYALVAECDCGLCAPAWARWRRKSRRFTEPVTLMMAIEAEPVGCSRRFEMVQEHWRCLGELLAATDELLGMKTIDDPARPSAGLALVMFGGELAAALRAREFVLEPLPEGRQVCLEPVTAATAAGCLVKMGEMVELAGAMASMLSSVLEP